MSQPTPTSKPLHVVFGAPAARSSSDPLVDALIRRWDAIAPRLRVDLVDLDPAREDEARLKLYAAACAATPPAPGPSGLVFGGFSLGARIAVRHAASLAAPRASLGAPRASLGAPRASLGARIAVRHAASLAAPSALLCFGYPFHRRGDPAHAPGLAALDLLSTPTLIVQGSRDPHGDRARFGAGRGLPACVRIHWIEDGNHRFEPRARSGRTREGNLAEAAEAAAAFLRGLPDA